MQATQVLTLKLTRLLGGRSLRLPDLGSSGLGCTSHDNDSEATQQAGELFSQGSLLSQQGSWLSANNSRHPESD